MPAHQVDDGCFLDPVEPGLLHILIKGEHAASRDDENLDQVENFYICHGDNVRRSCIGLVMFCSASLALAMTVRRPIKFVQ